MTSVAYLECTKVVTYPGGDHAVYQERINHFVNTGRRQLALRAARYIVPSAHALAPSMLPLGTSLRTRGGVGHVRAG
ncbi:hypothetical protein BKK79_38115 (plasmid) [Cupriavidus sp. USMAA2-4]|uniref:hypothetical protein n=1 Tax=unclassified Cupriavidus TaxID=2640874 RepID=UPI0008A6CD1F|nr:MULTISPECIES: hypothetical protein [unclassified Cupriavidus]AOY97740.1 hypothetical protein BKK79_38115 [Cupriavidus sp. USMAA2-4]AOZ04224.1 hypothetical protein BKK81_33050 [Cupriavidus sp. USMAHM13]